MFSYHSIRRTLAGSITLIILLTLTGCSYFNAYYNTKRTFDEAETERERSTEIQTRYSSYQKPVDAGARLIEMYPDSKYIDDALHLMGQAYYWLQDYHKARRKFEELLSNYPDSPHVQSATMWLGKVNVQLKKRQEATALLRGLIADTDDSKLISESRFALAELYYVDSLFVKAAEEFAEIPDISDDSKLIGEAYYRAGESLFRVQRHTEATAYLEKSQDYKLTNARRFESRLLQGQTLRESGHPEEALSIFTSLLKDKRYFKDHGAVRVQAGLALAYLGRREEAFEEWERTIQDYQRSDAAAQSYYEMGLIHLNTEGEHALAKEAFDESRLEKARSKYSLKADSMLTMLNRVDDLNLSRVTTRKRIDYTELWVEDPVSPDDTTAFTSIDYYDSLEFDSLNLISLWKNAWRDSVVVPEPDSTELQNALQDSINLAAIADSLDRMIVPVDSAATGMVEMRPEQRSNLDPMLEYLPRPQIEEHELVDTLHALPDSSEFADAGRDVFESLITEEVEDTLSVATADSMSETYPDGRTIIPGFPDEERRRDMMAERFGGPGMSAEGRMMYLGDPQDSTIVKPPESSSLAVDDEPEPEPDIETITIYDITPVLDSLSQMRVDLQETRFQLGEIQLFDLEQPDSARRIFQELSEPPNVDSVRARAMTILAYIERENGDSTLALSMLHDIADNFPGTRSGRQVIDLLDLDSDEPVSPSEEAYREAERLYLDEQLPQDAYTQYLWVSDTYPDSEWAPRALYAAAYIAGMELNEGENVEELLNRIIESYAETSQAQRAREKISAYDAVRYAAEVDTVDLETEFADIDAFGEEEVDEIAQMIGGIPALSSTLEGRNLLPQEVIQGTGGEVLLRFIVDA
ncbi:MAG TPA: tetratricopeptide repeat protein, partial [Bacteroidetes bacterium]|nr:tetratricopeptide repeat protein [Bacteroidota bacterium]HEX05174.1 tetratricopeptide repeat protein [Bacteroidota bacterium]